MSHKQYEPEVHKQWKLISHSSEGWEVQDLHGSMVEFW